MVQFKAPSLSSMRGCSGKVLKTMIYSLKRCWVNTIPWPIIHPTNIVFLFCRPMITEWEHLLSLTLVLGFLCFSFYPLFVCLLSLSEHHHISHQPPAVWLSKYHCWGFGLILSYQLKDQVNDFIWRPDYLIFPRRVAALTHRGRSTETALINSAGGSVLSGKEIHK